MAERTLLERAERIHLVGVGGAGMSAIARYLGGRGHRVSGSDAKHSPILDALAEDGVRTWAGHDVEGLSDVDLVVASSAVPDDDPELRAAEAAGIPVLHRPALLAAITSETRTIGPTGTHGKTSTAAMLVVGARAAGLDPSFVVGGDLLDLGTNARAGTTDLLVLEVDEAFGTFEHVDLAGLAVTSIEADHLDHFGSLAAIESAFERVARRVAGPVVACLDDPGAAALARRVDAVGYGTAEGATWRILDAEPTAGGVRFRLRGPTVEVPVEVPRPGLHMARNATGALALLGALGVDVEAAAAGLGSFQGVGRRWELRGEVDGITVIDDYAHHPTEVAATLAAASASGRRVVAVFQPHLYSRTLHHADAFGVALAAAGVVVVLDVYGARETPVPGVTGRLVSDAARRAGATVIDAPERMTAAAVVGELVRPGDLVVCMGAGDITALPDELLELLRRAP